MRFSVFFLVSLLTTVTVRAEPPALLQAAVERYAADVERWAYTQTIVGKDRKGAVDTNLIVRYDPSLPFEEQWTLLRIDGKEPTEGQIKKQRKDQEKRRKKRISLGELLDLDRATLVEDSTDSATYEIPLVKAGNQRLPPEKFRVTARVGKASQSFEIIAVELREGFRLALVAKLQSGEALLNFATVDPQFAPTITTLRADGRGSILFVKVGGDFAVTRTDFKRVIPYSERFKVKLGPLKFLDF